jgi:nucleoside phosphorylase
MADDVRKAVIIAALPIEREAVLEHLHDVREASHPQGSIYRRGVFDEESAPWDVLVAEIGAGNESAAAEVERAINFFGPEVAIFVGVAGAIKDVKRGDVVASTEVYHYESGKDRTNYFETRPKTELPSYSLLARARHEAGEADWLRRIKVANGEGSEQAKLPKAKVGPIAAGPKVLASRRSDLFRFLRQHYGDAIAVEMEGFGFLHGVRMNHPVEGIVIRAMSDQIGDKSPEGDAYWQPLAARNAAAFTFQVLSKFKPGGAGGGGGGGDRKKILESILRSSIARCVERWQALGVVRPLAVELAKESPIGAPGPSLLPSIAAPLKILVGEMGIGKSLRLERWHQQCITRALQDPNAPVPVYIEAAGDVVSVEKEIDRRAAGLGDWRALGATLALDRIERAGPSGAEELLKECRRLVTAYPGSAALLASRPLLRLQVEENVGVKELSEPDTVALMSRFAGHELSPHIMHDWPESLRAAIRRPLFAILTGLDIAQRPGRTRSVGGLISRLVEQALGGHSPTEGQLLRRLAVKCIDAGYASVRAGDVAEPDAIGSILDSNLVVARNGTLRFSLDVLTDWFAAHALTEGEITVDTFCTDPERLERWRYALAIAVGTFSHEVATRILRPIASASPAFASQVIDEGMDRYAFPYDPELPAAPPALESGEKIHETMEAWKKGLGSLARLVMPVDQKGELLPIGVASNGPGVSVSWNGENRGLPPVSKLPAATNIMALAQQGWMNLHWARPASVSAWAWSWSLSELSGRLKQVIERHALPLLPGPLLDEEIWHQAIVLCRIGSLFTAAIPLDDLRARIQPFGPRCRLGHWNGRSYDFAELREAIERLAELKVTELNCPWPGRDRDGGRYVWSSYSPARLCERAQQVMAGALKAYSQLVEAYFPRFVNRLPLAGLMPVHLIGHFLSLDPGGGDAGPWLQWFFEPLDAGSRNQVSLDVGAAAIAAAEKLDGRAVFETIRRRRPDRWRWVYNGVNRGHLDIFQDRPATDLAYRWLERDLREVHWFG